AGDGGPLQGLWPFLRPAGPTGDPAARGVALELGDDPDTGEGARLHRRRLSALGRRAHRPDPLPPHAVAGGSGPRRAERGSRGVTQRPPGEVAHPVGKDRDPERPAPRAAAAVPPDSLGSGRGRAAAPSPDRAGALPVELVVHRASGAVEEAGPADPAAVSGRRGGPG